MAMGDKHIETGTLQLGHWGFSLALDDGGVWQLDMAVWGARKYLGQRVTIEGFRSEFDLIDVYRIRPGVERLA
ncbi:DUF5818 domain-containing protein [Altererythrobacter sp. Root672]|uniref:DUF5818 domain-containing protein n=1 Tax=Altererythrobacter sp. Root672 TaxID=1736584 RepID=UPI0006FCA70A|nr:DUF5818 domain-containing protein [Altererythrobacter sp. Root672]KRA83124.1 hypothetical protein ASD76_03365 [Altererythrobacter sp. Root672]